MGGGGGRHCGNSVCGSERKEEGQNDVEAIARPAGGSHSTQLQHTVIAHSHGTQHTAHMMSKSLHVGGRRGEVREAVSLKCEIDAALVVLVVVAEPLDHPLVADVNDLNKEEEDGETSGKQAENNTLGCNTGPSASHSRR